MPEGKTTAASSESLAEFVKRGSAGAAALTSGLATAGGIVGGGMVAGIGVVAAPAVMGAPVFGLWGNTTETGYARQRRHFCKRLCANGMPC